MSRLLLEICPDDGVINGDAAALPPILICAHEGQDAIAFEGTLGGKPLILRFKDGACAVENPTDAKKSVMGLGEWHIAEGWKLRVTQGMSMDANLSVATDDPSWAGPEIHVTTFNGTQTKRFRTFLPTGEGSELVAGRDSAKAGLVIDDEHVSRAHLRFFLRDGKCLVEDLGSRWGTKLNGQPLTDARTLKHGDELRLGKTCINYICYMDIVPESAPETANVESPGVESIPKRNPEDAKTATMPAARPAGKADPPVTPVVPATGKPLAESKGKPSDAGAKKTPVPPAAVEAKPAPTPAAETVQAEKPPAKLDAASPVDPAKKLAEAQKPAATPAAAEKLKNSAVPQKTPIIAAQSNAAPAPEPQKSPALLIIGAALVIILTLAGVAYLGYQLFVRRH